MNLIDKILHEANDFNDMGKSLYRNPPNDNVGHGAGVLPICSKTRRALVCMRSDQVDQPFTWGVWGGTIKKDETYLSGGKREFMEETGFSGKIKILPAFVFKNARIEYHNLIGLVDSEFTPRLNWEADDYAWCNYQELWELEPKHFGLETLLNKSGAQINKYLLPDDYTGDLVEKILKESESKKKFYNILESKFKVGEFNQ